MKHPYDRPVSLRSLVAGLAGASLLLAGCGGAGDLDTAPVSGTVTHQDQPVPGGGIVFQPIASGDETISGKPAAGRIANGSFTLSTYGDGDGAVIGRHRVTFTPPPVEAAEVPEGGHAEAPPPSPYAGLVPQPNEVDVARGGNQFSFELVPGSGQ